ncbi:Alpha/Beta hydrolase protein [Suillus clintonianus]|uniref:Alpha/Beta hydrolase protein n=1 Tax=Suillus clintonianus TaxID=1904413 RepID=UPI001B85C909|nr:Alpha/Beta hydrolase protein [Suillus clintonianus]KAG2148813.1 Alpha/Beta hydrolase protein [Suillus clintonianus]
MSKKLAPYGLWESPITADAIAEDSVSMSDIFVDSVTKDIYYVEQRASEGGRYVLLSNTTQKEVFGNLKDFNARTRVHEYGGAAAIAYNGTVYSSNFANFRIYAAKDGTIRPITPEDPNKIYRYADFCVHPVHTDLLVAIKEDHTHDTPQTVRNSLCVINSTATTVTSLVCTEDAQNEFYAAPTFSPSGDKLVWQFWKHPDMPWEGGQLYVADVHYNSNTHTLSLSNTKLVAGSASTISACYPLWASNDKLVFTSDEGEEGNRFANLWEHTQASTKPVLASVVQQDFCQPPWTLGNYPFAFLDENGTKAICVAWHYGRSVLYVVDITTGSYKEIKDESFDFVVVEHVRRLSDYKFVFTGLQSKASGAAVLCTLTGPSFVPNFQVLKSTASTFAVPLPEGIISPPIPYELTLAGGKIVYAVYYAPNNPAYDGSNIPGEKPPCVLGVHGGPTGLETQNLSWLKQYFTSRGYAWLDVNYSGSSCYGRAYVERLKGNWGITDVSDCIEAVQSPKLQPHIDTKRTAIRGGSSGGYTALASISLPSSAGSKPKFFASATSNYGISNLELLANDTHKFELTYMVKLLGGTLEEKPEVYHDRSPVYFSSRIETPLLVLQGNDDEVVPPAQSWTIIDGVIKSKGHVEAHFFDGEQHGWRTSETIKRAIEFEREWYEKTMVRTTVGK